MLTLGTAFHFNRVPEDGHLYVVISSVDFPNVVIVNLTTVRGRCDKSCLLTAGEHEFIQWDSRIAYEYGDAVPIDFLNDEVASGRITLRGKMSNIVLGKIWDGAAVTRNLKVSCLEILRSQGVI